MKDIIDLFNTALNQEKPLSETLKAHLNHNILIDLPDAKKQFLFFQENNQISFKEVKPKEKINFDCRISLTLDTLFNIAKHQINPQIAMLSEKISLTGNCSPAIYFFNLFTENHSQY